jgi:wobble nucleotide-excising tRNase|tara:strand:- start:1006 stop:3369 length:2364 start_codon:yes stop_codon:yes gene_type:complete
MLKRISHIKNIGAFQECQARPVEFAKITLIYGRNTYGKSTLGDVFSSLQKNDPSVLLARSSIPGTDQGQLVDMGFALQGLKEGDGKAVFRRGKWERGLTNTPLLRVYDDAFFHEHVFVARKFTRDTKLKFSDFILGSQGVQVAQLIEQKKQDKRKETGRKRSLERDAFLNIKALDEFIATDPPDSIDELVILRDKLREEHSALNRQKKDAAAIRGRLNLSPVNFHSRVDESSHKLNQLLQTSIETHHEVAKARLDAHIISHCLREDGAERWIQAGLAYNNNESCAFCGQLYNDDAKALLDAYQQYFNEEFDQHERYVNQEIEQSQPMLSVMLPSPEQQNLKQNEIVFQTYPELADDAEFQNLKYRYQSCLVDLLELSESATAPLNNVKKNFEKALALKKARPHQAIDVVDLGDLISKLNNIAAFVKSLDDVIDAINEKLNNFKESINDHEINQKQEKITAEGISISRKILRYEKKAACTEFQELNQSIAALDAEIPQLEESLRNDQSEYLNNFFGTINRYFTALGSHDFELTRGLDRSGHRPVYFLMVKFKEKDVNENDLDKIFSESDRRALGLSVFLSSLDAMSPADLAKTVVVFDDPVTSFDDHRVTQTHKKMIELSSRCEQIILLSHYKDGISQFLKTHAFSNNHDIKLITITKNYESSGLEVGDINSFLLTSHDECREDIIDFIERRIDRLKYRPRVFLEAELSYRFGKQIREHNVVNDSLGRRIDGLVDNEIISESVSMELHRWRETLNPEHHVFPGNDVEDQRNTARDFMRFIFHDLVPVG